MNNTQNSFLHLAMRQKVQCILAIVLVLALCGCSKNFENSKSGIADEETESEIVGTSEAIQGIWDENAETTQSDNKITKEQATLATVIKNDMIEFDNTYVEIHIYSAENYFFSNRSEAFYDKFIAFLENTTCSSQQVHQTDSNGFDISIFDGENYILFSIYESDLIERVSDSGTCYAYCEDIYNRFTAEFSPFLTENKKYCPSAETPIRSMYEYAVVDRKDNILESDYISRKPHLFYDSGIVHLWVQSGTGILTRTAKFFDVENGLVSPEYCGQTDYFDNMVCVAGSSEVVVYEMFSGDQICCFYRFEKPLGDCLEKICSAHFINDGKQIIIEYLNADFEKETQIFDLARN